MNIAIATSEFITEKHFDGGLANYTYRLARSLKEAGHRPVVFVRSDATEKMVFEGIEVYRFAIQELQPQKERWDEWIYRNKLLCKPYSIARRGLKHINMDWYDHMTNPHNYRFFGAKYRYTFKLISRHYTRWIKKVHQEVNFDIVHYSALGAIGLYRPKDIPCISRLSGSNAMAHEFGGYGEKKAEVLQQDKLEMRSMKNMDDNFGPSRILAGIISKKIEREIKIIETLYVNEVDKEDASVYETHLKDKKYALFFGTVGQIKGAGTIAKVIHSFLDKYRDHYFVFVGKVLHSPQEGLSMIEYVRGKAGEHKDRVIHFDKMQHATLYPIIRNSQFVVLPSLIDNFPNTCIEAMTHGKIVIGTFANGFEQLIDNRESGYLVHIDNGDELMTAMNEILSLPPEKKKEIEAKAVERTRKLDPKFIIPQLLDFYKSTIHSRKN